MDMSDDGRWLALGTIAPPGDPNVFLLDEAGQLRRSAQVGQRWIQQVGVNHTGETLQALCTMPEGRAGDFPTVYVCGQQASALPPNLGEPGWPQNLFQYGAHSNHTGVLLRGGPRGSVTVYDNRVLWLHSAEAKATAELSFPRPENAVTVSLCAAPSGHVLVGCAARRNGDMTDEPNLFFLSPPGEAKPRLIWTRPALFETDRGVPPEKGIYGAPTLPDGKRAELHQKDVPVFAPLSLAIHGRDEPQLLAAADYPAWQRWIRSSATLREQNYSTRFEPARPTVTVYDGRGKEIRRFAPEQFSSPLWVDLCFCSGGKYLLAYPHHWTCRGLAGQTILPADDGARTLFVLEIATGKVRALKFPDTISDVAASETGPVVAGCWDGRVYILGLDHLLGGKVAEGIPVGGPSLVRASRAGTRLVVATTTGEVRLLDGTGKEQWRKDLNRLVKPALKPWVANARATPIGPGVWQLPGGRVESDLGGQRVVEAPDGLILIEGHAGLSFEREWEAMKAVDLDPMRVKYVLATHEHGDHAPGAYLWRVVTGARFVCSEEMAYTLQHHLPISSGYGLHPPVPTDIRIKEDTELDLAGLKVRALRLPGHTAGSMGWLFTKGDRKYVAFGDLIMPDGPLGYAGSINFSARDVLTSLRKLQAEKPQVALPGHGPIGDPSRYLEAGIEVGVHVGWGKVRPEKPDPYFRLKQKNVQVVAWNIDIVSADFGDLDGDGKPDVAVVAPDGDGAVVKLFLNHDGKFRDEPDHQVRLPQLSAPSKIRLRHLTGGKRPDILVAGQSSAVLLLSQGTFPEYKVMTLPLGDVQQVRSADLAGDGSMQILVGTRAGGFHLARPAKGDRYDVLPVQPEMRGMYADFQVLDLNGDGRTDLVTNTGKVYLRQADGKLPATPTLQMPPPEDGDWTFLAVGDFNADRRPDVALLSYGMKRTRLAMYYNTGDPERPFRDKPDTTLDLGGADPRNQPPLLRDAPVVADWNGDGVADLIIGKGQDNQVLILLGGRGGLDLKRSTKIALDYRLHYETGLHIADFNSDGVPDLACLGYTSTGVGASGPLAVYLWTQGKNKGE
jgi:glyoxylase-like metal-dependent hydrolase (beta-lactamase superfamily II)